MVQERGADSKRIYKTTNDAQTAIASMVLSGSTEILPCKDCKYATESGCKKESFKNADIAESGPIYDNLENAMVCPLQRGVIYSRELTPEKKDLIAKNGNMKKAERTLPQEERKKRRDSYSKRTLGIPIIRF